VSRWDVALAAAAVEARAVLQKQNNPNLEPKEKFQIFL